jgi:hypothetical protein
MANEKRTVKLTNALILDGVLYGPGEVSLPAHLADIADRVEQPHREAAKAERETRKAATTADTAKTTTTAAPATTKKAEG